MRLILILAAAAALAAGCYADYYDQPYGYYDSGPYYYGGAYYPYSPVVVAPGFRGHEFREHERREAREHGFHDTQGMHAGPGWQGGRPAAPPQAAPAPHAAPPAAAPHGGATVSPHVFQAPAGGAHGGGGYHGGGGPHH